MNIRRIAAFVGVALLPLAVGAATLIVPASGTGPGANGSQWQTQLMLHNTSSLPIGVTLIFHDGAGAAESAAIDLAPRSTVCLDDVVKTKFNRESATGAIEVVFDDAFLNKLAATSRTFNRSSNGQFGQDIPAVNLASAATEGVAVVLNGPDDSTEARFNFGLFAAKAAIVKWELVRADGSVAVSLEKEYAAGTQTQYNGGIAALFAQKPQDDDVVIASVLQGSVLPYGSVINEATGDPTFVPGYATRPDTRVRFIGVDQDFNLSPEILDADRDGVLDAPVDIYAAMESSNAFQLVAADRNATFELVSSAYPTTVSPDGLVMMVVTSPLPETGMVKVRVSLNGETDILRIPLRFHSIN
jgi:hypothetical protein